jgi:hypothetical protein
MKVPHDSAATEATADPAVIIEAQNAVAIINPKTP